MVWRAMIWAVRLVALALALSLATVLGATGFFAARGLGPVLEKRADVVIVLSAGLDRDAASLDNFTRERVKTAVELWRRGVAPAILMSGGVDAATRQHVGESMKSMAIDLGVPEAVIFVEGFSTSTFENARFTLRVAREEGWRRSVIVSDDFHLLRARVLFEVWRTRDGVREDVKIVSMAPASGRAAASIAQSTWMIAREALSYPYNVGKVALQIALDLAGLGDGRMVR